MNKTNDLFLTIEKLVIGGQGLARLPDGMVVLVPHVLAGEKVQVRPVRRKKSFMEARLVEILEPSEDRATPPCPYFFHCGGCDFQHARIDRQAAVKKTILDEQLHRFFFQVRAKDICSAPMASPKPFYYRQRIRLQMDEEGSLGFYRHHSHKVEEVSSCMLARPELNTMLDYLDNSVDFAGLKEYVRSVELLLSPVDEKIILLLQMRRKIRPAEKKRIEKTVNHSEMIKAAVVSAEGQGSVTFFNENLSEVNSMLFFDHVLPGGERMRMSLEAGGFSQVNPEQNENLIALVMEWADIERDNRVLDLFCGMGNFTLPLARFAKDVVGMDLQRSAIRSARRNADANGLGNCLFTKYSAVEGARSLVERGEKFDLVLLDPPRQGCADVIAFLPGLDAKQIIYISCDPATLCRDLLLLEKEGYEIEKIKMVDMFPQTHHMETVVSLTTP